MSKFSVELTTGGICPHQEDVDADDMDDAVYQFLKDYVIRSRNVSLRPITGKSDYSGWHELVISVGPCEEYDE